MLMPSGSSTDPSTDTIARKTNSTTAKAARCARSRARLNGMSAFLTRVVVAAGQSVEYLIAAKLCWGEGTTLMLMPKGDEALCMKCRF